MKNKKLFAVITLICFALTMMPVAAFAAGKTVVHPIDSDKATVSITTADELNVNATTTSGAYYWAEDKAEKVVALAADGMFKFDTEGTYYVYGSKGTETTAIVTESATMTKAQIVGLLKDRAEKEIFDDVLTVKVKAADVTYKLDTKDGVKDITIKADNGWSKDGKVVVKLVNQSSGANVKNANIVYTTNSGYVDVQLDEATTDRKGEQVIYITSTKAGKFKVFANYGDAEELVINVTVDASGINTISTVAEPARGTALGTVFNRGNGFTGAAFEIVSADGTILDNALTVDKDYKISIVEKPADSTLDAKDLVLNYDATTNNAYVLKAAAGTNPSFDSEGKYVIKVALESGSSATATVNVVKFIKPVKLSLVYKSNSVAWGKTVDVKATTFIDANGTVLSAAHPDYTKYAGAYDKETGVYAGIKYAANGKPLAAVSETGSVTVKNELRKGDEMVGQTITAMAIVDKYNLTASATLTVVDQAATLKYAKTEAEAGITNKLIVNTVDENGNKVAAGLTADNADVFVYVVSAPTNAVYAAAGRVTGVDEVTVDFTCSMAGEYQLQTIVRNKDGVKVDERFYYSCMETIVVGGSSTYKDIVVMPINAAELVKNGSVISIPVASTIVDGRTMVPLRALIEAFGATCNYDAATQTITVVQGGTTVVMTVGSVDYTVNGVAKKADVAPYVVGEGYTMVPVRFVATAFGITPTPIYDANNAVSDVLFAK